MRLSTILNPIRRVRSFLIKISIFAGITGFIIGCGDEPTFLGRDLLPSIDDVDVMLDTNTVIQAYTALAKPIITVSNTIYLLGSINDPVFGYSEASIVTQAGIQSAINFRENRIVDSILVFLRVNDFYGDSLSTQSLKIFDMIEDIKSDSTYFSNTSIEGKYDPEEIGSASFNAKDTIIKVIIDNQNFINKFLTAEDSMFQSNANFRQVFKGFYFAVEPKTENGGSIAYLDLESLDSRMILYYDSIKVINDSTNLSNIILFGGVLNSFNIFNNRYENYPPSVSLNNPDAQDTVLFLTPMAGINVHLKFPELEKWRDKKDDHISIIKAELFIGVEDSVYQWNNNKLFPQNLFLFYINDQGNYNQVYDFRINENTFGGAYNIEEKGYKFNFGYHLQSYIDGKIENFEMVLISANSNASASRVLLKSPLAMGKNRMKIKIIYTEI